MSTIENYKPLKKNRTNDGKFFIFHAPDLYELYAEISCRPDWQKMEEALNERKFTVKDGDVSYRVINHWMAQGLLDDEREPDSKGWRKLSFKDVLWLRVLRELRQFGLPLEKLRNAYKTLFFLPQGQRAWYFDLALALCTSSKPTAVFLVVFDEGEAEIATLHSLRCTDSFVAYDQSYIRINLNVLCREVFGDKIQMPIPTSSSKSSLSDTEQDVIDTLRNNEYDEVRVHLQNGTINRIDKSKKVEGEQRIVDLMQETDFGEITVKVADGKPVHTTVLKKTRPNK